METMLSLEIDEQDAIELLRRIRTQRALREVDLREPDPVCPEELRSAIAAHSAAKGGYHFTCICGRGVIARATVGICPGCGIEFDISEWGR